jgi:hypothetical protein
MKAYKFLAEGRRAIFSGLTWPEGAWVEADGPPDTCRAGIHGCLPQHLAYWVLDELWEMELDGELVQTPLKVVAPRGRLGSRVTGWNDDARSDFMAEGIRRTVCYAALELREIGLDAEADSLESADNAALGERAAAVGDGAARAGERDAADLAGFIVDVVEYTRNGHTVGPAFIAAHAADLHSPIGVDDPFAAERESQGLWLAQRLGLTTGA